MNFGRKTTAVTYYDMQLIDIMEYLTKMHPFAEGAFLHHYAAKPCVNIQCQAAPMVFLNERAGCITGIVHEKLSLALHHNHLTIHGTYQ